LGLFFQLWSFSSNYGFGFFQLFSQPLGRITEKRPEDKAFSSNFGLFLPTAGMDSSNYYSNHLEESLESGLKIGVILPTFAFFFQLRGMDSPNYSSNHLEESLESGLKTRFILPTLLFSSKLRGCILPTILPTIWENRWKAA